MINNKFFLEGFILRKPELKISKNNDKKFCKGAVSVRTNKKNEEGYFETMIFNFTAFDKTAEYIAEYCTKGTRVNLFGQLKTSAYSVSTSTQDEEGNLVESSKNVNTIELIVQDVGITRSPDRKISAEDEKNKKAEIVNKVEDTTNDGIEEPLEESQKVVASDTEESTEDWYEKNKATRETVPGLVGYEDDDDLWEMM